jgi:hypothetical protein
LMRKFGSVREQLRRWGRRARGIVPRLLATYGDGLIFRCARRRCWVASTRSRPNAESLMAGFQHPIDARPADPRPLLSRSFGRAGASEMMVPHAQAAQRLARQEAAGHHRPSPRRSAYCQRPSAKTYFKLSLVRSTENLAMNVALHQFVPNPPGLIGVKEPSNRAF